MYRTLKISRTEKEISDFRRKCMMYDFTQLAQQMPDMGVSSPLKVCLIIVGIAAVGIIGSAISSKLKK